MTEQNFHRNSMSQRSAVWRITTIFFRLSGFFLFHSYFPCSALRPHGGRAQWECSIIVIVGVCIYLVMPMWQQVTPYAEHVQLNVSAWRWRNNNCFFIFDRQMMWSSHTTAELEWSNFMSMRGRKEPLTSERDCHNKHLLLTFSRPINSHDTNNINIHSYFTYKSLRSHQCQSINADHNHCLMYQQQNTVLRTQTSNTADFVSSS